MKLPGWVYVGLELCRKILIILVLGCFVLVTTSGLFGWVLVQVAENPSTYQSAIDQSGVMDLNRVFFNQLFARLVSEKGQAFPLINKVPGSAWQSFIDNLIPDSYFISVDKNIVQGILAWLKEDTQTPPDITVDLKLIKDNLRSASGTESVLQVSQSFPVCADASVKLDVTSLINLECIPSNINLALISPLLANTIADIIPDQVSINDLLQTGIYSEETYAFIGKARLAQKLIMIGLALALKLSLFLIVLFALLQSASWRRLVRTLAIPFYLSGFACLIIITLLHFLLQPVLAWVLGLTLPGLAVDQQLTIGRLAGLAGNLSANLWLWYAIGLIAVGFVFFMANSIIETRLKRRLAYVQKLKNQRRTIRKQFR